MKVNRRGRSETVEVTADGEGFCSHAGALLLVNLADRLGLTEGLSRALAGTRERRSAHDDGEILRDLIVTLVQGGEHLCDLAALRDQPDLFGTVASDSTAFRLLERIGPCELEGVRGARKVARERAFELGARPEQLILDVDATLVGSHSDKEQAAGNYKGGYGFHPLQTYLDETNEALGALLRPGNAGANTAEDHKRVLDRALAQIPADAHVSAENGFPSHLSERRYIYEFGYEGVQDAQWVVLDYKGAEYNLATFNDQVTYVKSLGYEEVASGYGLALLRKS